MIKSPTSKLFKLKKWLTLAEAAKHLSGVCGEEVTEADILRLALDRHLKLSVNFVNHAHVRPRQVVYFDEEELKNSINKGIYPNEFKFYAMPFSNEMTPGALLIGPGKFLKWGGKIVEIEGVWDLPMIGGEEIYVKNKYHELTDGLSVDLICIDGAFVSGNDDIICELQDRFDEDKYGYKAQWQVQLDKLNRLQFNKTKNPRKDKILVLRKEKLKKQQEIVNDWNKQGQYYPAFDLPEDTILVVRTDALREFEQLIANNEQENSTTPCSSPNKSEPSESERNSMLKLIIGMAIDAYGYKPDSARNSATGDKNGISARLQAHGINITDDTIRKYLTEAKNII